jgi:hypothetical protein
MKTIHVLILGIILGRAASSTWSQTPPRLPPLPNGFQTDPGIAQAQAPVRAAGVGDGVRGTKPNDNMSPCFTDPKVSFGYGWMANPAGQTMVDMILKAPQDPATRGAANLDEPVSKYAYLNGVLEWRKQTWPVISGQPCKDSQVVFYQGKWTGFTGSKLITISVYNLYNSQDAGQAWIDEYIGKLTNMLGSK